MPQFSQVNSSGQEVWKNGSVSFAFTPAASSHTALDSVGGAATGVLKGAAGRMVKLTGYRFNVGTTTPVTSVWTLYMYNATPAVIADDAAYVVVTADGAKVQGTVTLAQLVDFGSTWIESQGLIAGFPVQMVTDTMTCYLQNITTLTTEALPHTVTLYYEIQP